MPETIGKHALKKSCDENNLRIIDCCQHEVTKQLCKCCCIL